MVYWNDVQEHRMEVLLILFIWGSVDIECEFNLDTNQPEHKYSGECVKNICTCRGGEEAKDEECLTSGEFCASCDLGWVENTVNHTCVSKSMWYFSKNTSTFIHFWLRFMW